MNTKTNKIVGVTIFVAEYTADPKIADLAVIPGAESTDVADCASNLSKFECARYIPNLT